MQHIAYFYICGLLGLTLLAMCSDSPAAGSSVGGVSVPSATAASRPSAPVSAEAAPTAPARPARPAQPADGYPDQPADVVRSFLAALQSAPDGAGSLAYLTPQLAAQATAGTSVRSFLGIKQIYWGFDVDIQDERDAAGALVSARLRYDEGALLRRFKLARGEAGAWQIADIIDPAPARALPQGEVAAAEQIARDYIAAFAGRRTAEARALLCPSLRARLAERELAYGLDDIETVEVADVQSFAVASDRVVLLVALEITLPTDHSAPWIAGSTNRFITVVRTAQGWLIEDVRSVPPAL